ncbi:MAG: 2Fe-2S iron-sulfur cluster-binding protein [Ilumatobacteraceae bacterium]
MASTVIALTTDAPIVEFALNGEQVQVPATGTLLDTLREVLGVRSVKDGCSPQGQCGCCTVWVDGRARVSCVTPVVRVAGRAVTTVEGLDDADRWADSFCARGGSQCGFCTPGIIMRAAALDGEQRSSTDAVRQAMLAHLCRCTGWQPIVDSIVEVDVAPTAIRSPDDAAERARIEGGVDQTFGAAVALGLGGFSDDTAPPDALVAVRSATGEWVIGRTLDEARQRSFKVQGRRTTAPVSWPVDVPPGSWVRTLQTTWVEPAYLEPDASWCEPGGSPMSSLGNGGAFGGKQTGALGAVARRLADEHGTAVRVLSTREDVVMTGPKRPPVGAGVGADGTVVVHVARTEGIDAAIRSAASAVDVEIEVVEVDVFGPPTSSALRGAGWAEVAVLLASFQPGPTYTVRTPHGAIASATVDDDGAIRIRVECGRVLDDVVLMSYCTGAAHMALGWVTAEGLSVDATGVPHDLTIRSFGVLRAVDTPTITVEVVHSDAEPVNGSDAVFAAVATAAWARTAWSPRWPTAH